MAGDDLVAQNTVMVLCSHKTGTVESKTDAEPDRYVKKVRIGMKGRADAVHAIDKVLPCASENIACPQNNDAF